MPKESFFTWSGPEPHRKIFELRWAKETDVDPAKTVIYLPPLPAETPDGVLEMLGNGGDTAEIDRLIAALKRAKRAMLGTSTASDGFVDYLPDAVKQGKITSEEASRAKEQVLRSRLSNGIVFVPDTGPAVLLEGRAAEKFSEQDAGPADWDLLPVEVGNMFDGDIVWYLEGAPGGAVVQDSKGSRWEKSFSSNLWWGMGFSASKTSADLAERGPITVFSLPKALGVPENEQEHNPTDICPVPGCNCDLDYRAAQATPPLEDRLQEVLKRWDDYLTQSEAIYTKKNLPGYQKGIAGARDDIRKMLEN